MWGNTLELLPYIAVLLVAGIAIWLFAPHFAEYSVGRAIRRTLEPVEASDELVMLKAAEDDLRASARGWLIGSASVIPAVLAQGLWGQTAAIVVLLLPAVVLSQVLATRGRRRALTASTVGGAQTLPQAISRVAFWSLVSLVTLAALNLLVGLLVASTDSGAELTSDWASSVVFVGLFSALTASSLLLARTLVVPVAGPMGVVREMWLRDHVSNAFLGATFAGMFSAFAVAGRVDRTLQSPLSMLEIALAIAVACGGATLGVWHATRRIGYHDPALDERSTHA